MTISVGFSAGYTKNGQANKAIDLFNEIQAKRLLRHQGDAGYVESATILFVCMISALSHIAMLDISESLVEEIPSDFLRHPRIQNALIDMWVSADAFRLIRVGRFRPIPLGQSWECEQGRGNL